MKTPLRLSCFALVLVCVTLVGCKKSDGPGLSSHEQFEQSLARYEQDRLDKSFANRLCQLEKAPPYADLDAVTVRVDVGQGCGTGVLVTRQVGMVKKTFVWTAGHVVDLLRNKDGSFRNASIYQEEREDGKYAGGMRTEAKVIAYSSPDTGEDLALLLVLKDNFTEASASFADRYLIPSVGTELVHVGCTRGLYNSVSLGVISQSDRDIGDGKTFDQTSTMGYPGSSGGGVYFRNGVCIGLLTRGIGPGLNFIVPARRMHEWAKKMNVEWALDERLPVHIYPSRDMKPMTDTPFTPPDEEPCALSPGGPAIDNIIRIVRKIVQDIIGCAATYPSV